MRQCLLQFRLPIPVPLRQPLRRSEPTARERHYDHFRVSSGD